MVEQFADHHLNIPRLSILGTDNSDLFHPQAASKGSQAQLPKELSKHPGFARVFKPGKLTFGLIAPFKGYPDTPIPDVYDLGESARLAEKAGFASLWIRDVPFYDLRFGDVGQGLAPFVTLGYLAAKTKKIALGTAGIIAPLREPIHIAKVAATTLVQAMDEASVKRLIWTSSLGIYNEIPGEFGRWNQQVMGDYYRRYRLAADVIEGRDLDYTIIRPAWLTNLDEVDYETTLRDEPFKGTEVSRKSVASLAVSVIKDPAKFVRESVGVDKPGTAADRPRPAVMSANGGYEPATREEIKLRFP